MSPNPKAPVASVVLLSGGLDSVVNLALCVEKDQPVLALTANYGQRARFREVESAQKLANYYGVRHQVVDLQWLGTLGQSALTTTDPVPHLRRDALDDLSQTRSTAQKVWVPNRNGVLIGVASAFAESFQAPRVVVGFNREEATTFPDNSREFMEASTRALSFSSAHGVEVFSYTDHLSKTEMVRLAQGLSKSIPWDWIWSCYEGGAQPCGRCESCLRFERATREIL